MAFGLPHIRKQRNLQPEPLRFRKDGTFRLLQVSDLHLVDPEMDDDPDPAVPLADEANTYYVYEQLVERTDPDLIVLTGDNVSGYWQEYTYNYLQKVIGKITGVAAKKNIPLALVFGNHDSELNFHREIQMTLYLEYANCRACYNAEEMYGCGTYNLPILASDGSDRKAFNLWLFDSNDYPRDADGKFIPEYDYVHPDQIAWYEKTAAKLRQENGGEPLPSILFQHIPVQQEYDCIKTAEAPIEGVVGFTDGDGKFWYMPDAISGRLRETPCPPAHNHREQFDSWVKTGDIVAAFFGHDHVNDFVVEKDGILLVQTLGAGFWTYGKERGGRCIILHEDDPRHIDTTSIEVMDGD